MKWSWWRPLPHSFPAIQCLFQGRCFEYMFLLASASICMRWITCVRFLSCCSIKCNLISTYRQTLTNTQPQSAHYHIKLSNTLVLHYCFTFLFKALVFIFECWKKWPGKDTLKPHQAIIYSRLRDIFTLYIAPTSVISIL